MNHSLSHRRNGRTATSNSKVGKGKLKTDQSKHKFYNYKTMPPIVVRHKVGDLTPGSKGTRTGLTSSQNRVGFQTFRMRMIQIQCFVADVFDLDGMQATMSNPDIIGKIAKEKHTVLEPITVSIR
jgi:hypothetical protein